MNVLCFPILILIYAPQHNTISQISKKEKIIEKENQYHTYSSCSEITEAVYQPFQRSRPRYLGSKRKRAEPNCLELIENRACFFSEHDVLSSEFTVKLHRTIST